MNKCKIDHVESVIYLYWVPNINCLHQRLSQHQNTLRKILNLQEAVMFFHSLPLWRNCFRFNVFSREGRKTRQYSQSSLCFPCFYLFCCPASPWGTPISQKYMGKNRKKLEISFSPAMTCNNNYIISSNLNIRVFPGFDLFPRPAIPSCFRPRPPTERRQTDRGGRLFKGFNRI